MKARRRNGRQRFDRELYLQPHGKRADRQRRDINRAAEGGQYADMSADTGSVTYSVDSVVWSPAVSGKFAGETVYTVTMTLSAMRV
jgi:hypothetical protein